MTPALDRVFLDELLDGDREFGEELFQAFAEASRQWLSEARTACQDGNVAQATRAFHTLKGSASSVGLVLLRDLARELEMLSRESNLTACAARLDELEALAKQGRGLLTAFLETL